MKDRGFSLFFGLLCLLSLLVQGAPAWSQGAAGDTSLLDELTADYEQNEQAVIPDPLEKWNRLVFSFNDKVYLCLLQPVATGYGRVIPEEIRKSLQNFFHNLGFPIRLVNCLLQGRSTRALQETGSFLLNSSVGLGGLAEVSKEIEGLSQPLPEEDLGQTLGYWGLGEGLYLVWPVLGPSHLRDTFGRFGDYFLNPLSYTDPSYLGTVLKIEDRINTQSFDPDQYSQMKQGALDPYTSFKDGYVQYRRKQVQQ